MSCKMNSPEFGLKPSFCQFAGKVVHSKLKNKLRKVTQQGVISYVMDSPCRQPWRTIPLVPACCERLAIPSCCCCYWARICRPFVEPKNRFSDRSFLKGNEENPALVLSNVHNRTSARDGPMFGSKGPSMNTSSLGRQFLSVLDNSKVWGKWYGLAECMIFHS